MDQPLLLFKKELKLFSINQTKAKTKKKKKKKKKLLSTLGVKVWLDFGQVQYMHPPFILRKLPLITKRAEAQ
jgi:hypothetical protein